MSTLQYTLPAVVAGTPQTIDLGIVEGHGGGGFAVGEVRMVTRTAQAAQGATNFATLTLSYVRAGASPVTIATVSLGASALVQDIPLSWTFVTGAQERDQLQDGDVLQLSASHTGTGGALAAGAVLEVQRD